MAMAMAMALTSSRLSSFLSSLLSPKPLPTSSSSSSSSSSLSSPFLPAFSYSSSIPKNALRFRKRARSLPCVRALEVDQDTLLAIGVGLAGIAVGIGIPVFYEMQVKAAQNRDNDQPCFPCKGTGSQTCRFCLGAGNISIELTTVGEKEVSKCVNCEGAGSITCTTCQGSGIQPRYLDRREFKDDD